jgi:hypothetical protein
MFEPGSIVIVHLADPAEKLWGVLERLDATGVVLRGIGLSGLDDWMRQIASGDEPSLGLSTTFLPMRRVERLYLDEEVGEVESYRQQFERRVGSTVEAHLDLSR